MREKDEKRHKGTRINREKLVMTGAVVGVTINFISIVTLLSSSKSLWVGLLQHGWRGRRAKRLYLMRARTAVIVSTFFFFFTHGQE